MKQTLRYLGLSGILVAPVAMGAGFQLNEFSVTAMGRAQAGEPAMQDTAAAMARNPAAMGGFDEAAASLTFHYIDPNIDVEGTSSANYRNVTIDTSVPSVTDTTTTLGAQNADADDVAPEAGIPGLYYIHPIDDKLAVGLSFNSYYGLSTDYGDNYTASNFAEETSITTYYLTPTISYKPVENLTLGLGVHYIYGEGEIKNSSNPAVLQATGGTIPLGTTLLDLEGDGDAFGYQVGLQWDVTEATRIGLRYQSRVNLDLEGDMIKYGSPEVSGTLTINLPEVYELGLVHEYSDKLSLMAGLQKTGWHTFKDLTVKVDGAGSDKLKEEDWEDAWRYSIGAEYVVMPKLTLRAGFGHDESPVKDNMRTLSIPDADRNWFSFGGSYGLDDMGSIDVAVLYITGSAVDVNEEQYFSETISNPNATTEVREYTYTEFDGELSSTDAIVLSVGYNYEF